MKKKRAPAKKFSMKELYWAAGFMEGEGSFTFQASGQTPRVCAVKLRIEKGANSINGREILYEEG